MKSFLFKHVKSLFLDRPLPIGTVIAKDYQIKKVLGIGSYGISYVVKNQTNHKDYVLKQMKPSLRKEQRVHTSFQYEKQILSQLQHPRIPKCIASFQVNGQYFIVMEYMPGKTFEDLIFRDHFTFNETDAFQIIADLLNIISYIHRQNIIHRDIRLPNVLWKDGTCFLIDFGLARCLHVDKDKEDGNHYKISQHATLKRELHVKSDFYALGHFALFLLYTNFTPKTKKEKSWEEELLISSLSKMVIRKLLQIDEPYRNVDEIKKDVDRILNRYPTL